MRRQWQRCDRVLACLAPQGGASSQTIRQGDRLQRILYPRPHAYPLMTVSHQSSQILELFRRQPDRRKAVFHQQLQNQACISPIMFLLARLGCPNHCRVTNLAFHSQIFHQVHKPLHRSRGFDAHTHRAWKRRIKLSHAVSFVQQSYFHQLPGFGVQHRQSLLASVKVTSYNPHLGLLRSEHC
jgi:hypothetical protein